MSKKSVPALLDTNHASFVQGGVAIIAASRDPLNAPRIARAVGCRVSNDRRRVTVLFPKARSAELLEVIGTGGPIAVTFTQPSTHRTIQIKAKSAAIASVASGDVGVIERCVNAFVEDVCRLGYPEPLIRMLLWYDPRDLAAVEFIPDAAFQQTPGPRAGTLLNAQC